MLPFAVVVIRSLYLWYDKSNKHVTSMYTVYNKWFKSVLEGQTFKDKPTPLFAIKNLLFWYGNLSSFLHIVSSFFVEYLFPTSVTTSH